MTLKQGWLAKAFVGGSKRSAKAESSGTLPGNELDELLPFLAGSIDYSERYGSIIDDNRFLKRVIVVCLLVIGYQSWTESKLAREVRFVPYLVRADENGATVVQPSAPGADTFGEQALLGTAGGWVRAMRNVMATREAQEIMVQETFSRLAPGTAARDKANAWFREHNPYEAVGERRVVAEVTRAYKLASTARDGSTIVGVDWKEHSSSTAMKETRFYSAQLTMRFSEVRTKQTRDANPIGLYVVDYSISDVTKGDGRQ